MSKTKKPAAAAAPADDQPKTPEQLREEAEKKSAETAELVGAFALATQSFRKAADVADGASGGRLAKADAQQAMEDALADGQEGWDKAMSLLPDDPADEDAAAA